MKAEIITIGDEILIGQVIDTNSAWMGQELNRCGIEVYQVRSIHDNREHILSALKSAQQNADLVLITGGLGPTKDDITKKVLCEYFNCQLHYHKPTLEAVEARLSKRGIPMSQLNKDQALVPNICTVLSNKEGTAPGMWFEKDNTIFVSMPGVPYEMKSIMKDEVLTRLLSQTGHSAIKHKTILIYGIPESVLSDMLNQWEDQLPKHIKLAYLPHQLTIRLRLSAVGENSEQLEKELEELANQLKELIPNNIVAIKDESLGSILGETLAKLKKTIAVAESCSGGSLAHAFTAVAGSSNYFKGGVVAYANEVKQEVLGVSQECLANNGAVSEQTAIAMANGVRALLKTDYAIATTGIAGPDGGSEEKPVGTVWIAIANGSNTTAQKFSFLRNREHNIERTVQSALVMLKQIIDKTNNIN